MIWQFSDGTLVELGGNVIGASVFAQELRQVIPTAVVELTAPPAPTIPLDTNDSGQLDRFLRDELEWFKRTHGVRLTSSPKGEELEALPAVPEDEEPVPTDAVY